MITKKLPWIAAATIIVVVAVGAWALLGTPAAPSGQSGKWGQIASGTPGQAVGYPTHSPKSGINAIHFMKHGSPYVTSDNLFSYAVANDNRIGSITASGATIATFPFDVAFDIILDVSGNKDNMGQMNKGYLTVSLGLRSSTTLIYMLFENSLDANENVYSSPANYIHINAKWDNAGNTGYKLTADDNMFLENISLWLRG